MYLIFCSNRSPPFFLSNTHIVVDSGCGILRLDFCGINGWALRGPLYPFFPQKYIHSCGAGGIVILCWIEGVLRRPLLGGFKFFHATASPNRPSTNAAYYHFSFFFHLVIFTSTNNSQTQNLPPWPLDRAVGPVAVWDKIRKCKCCPHQEIWSSKWHPMTCLSTVYQLVSHWDKEDLLVTEMKTWGGPSSCHTHLVSYGWRMTTDNSPFPENSQKNNIVTGVCDMVVKMMSRDSSLTETKKTRLWLRWGDPSWCHTGFPIEEGWQVAFSLGTPRHNNGAVSIQYSQSSVIHDYIYQAQQRTVQNPGFFHFLKVKVVNVVRC